MTSAVLTMPAAPAVPRFAVDRRRPRSSVAAAVVLALFGASLVAVAVGLPIATALGADGRPGDPGTTGVLVALAPLLVVAGTLEVIAAAGLLARRRWAAAFAEIAAILGLAATVGSAFAVIIGLDLFAPAAGEPAVGTVKNTLSALLLVTLGYWIVYAGARRAAHA